MLGCGPDRDRRGHRRICVGTGAIGIVRNEGEHLSGSLDDGEWIARRAVDDSVPVGTLFRPVGARCVRRKVRESRPGIPIGLDPAYCPLAAGALLREGGVVGPVAVSY